MKQKTRIEKDKEANKPLVEDKYAHNEKFVNVQRKLRPNIDPRNSIIGLTSISEMKGISDIKGIRDIVNPYRSTPVQIHPRLTISQPNDQAEAEADRVAKSVASPLCPADISPRSGESSTSGNTGLQVSGELASEITGLSGGAALSSDQQVFFGEKLATDFSNVKIHNDSKAHNLAEALNAEAFTYGNNIVFNEGKYQPGTSGGKELLAHELVHVRQQRAENNNKTQYKIQKMGRSPKNEPSAEDVINQIKQAGINSGLEFQKCCNESFDAILKNINNFKLTKLILVLAPLIRALPTTFTPNTEINTLYDYASNDYVMAAKTASNLDTELRKRISDIAGAETLLWHEKPVSKNERCLKKFWEDVYNFFE